MAATPTPHPPRQTNHARDRWEHRARYPDPDDGPSIWTAWVDGIPISLPWPYSELGDEARYHHDQRVIVCRCGPAITTVYDLVGPDSSPRVRRAVETQLDITLPTQ